MFFDLARNLGEVPQMETVDEGACPPFWEDSIEIHWNNWIIHALSVGYGEGDDWRIMAVEIFLNLALEVITFHVFVVFYENELLSHQPTMR